MRAILPILLLAIAAPLATAGPIVSPTAAYLNATSVITFSDVDEALLHIITTNQIAVEFSSLLRASTVGDNWASWGSPPNTESATPRVLWSGLDDNFDPVTTVTFLLSRPVSVFGFEAEPGPTSVHTLTASYFMQGQLLQTISRDVSGTAGAVLFAASAAPGTFFDSVKLTSDADWAVGQLRYAPVIQSTTAAPEPQSWLLLASGLAILGYFSRTVTLKKDSQ